jgi:hypothetical protein
MVTSETAAGAIVIVKDAVAVWFGEDESVTVKDSVNVPELVGVPEITPPEDRFRPGASPAAVQVYGVVPPVVASVVLGYATSTCPFGKAVVVMDTGVSGGSAATIVIEIVRFAVSAGELESVTVNITLIAPAVVGVPVIAPAALRLKPSGSVVEDHEYGVVPPIAARVCEYATPTWPFGKLAVVI